MNAVQVDNLSADPRETVYLFGGLALMLFGAGMILSNPVARRYLGNLNIMDMLQGVIPDFDRYMKLRAM